MTQFIKIQKIKYFGNFLSIDQILINRKSNFKTDYENIKYFYYFQTLLKHLGNYSKDLIDASYDNAVLGRSKCMFSF